MKPEVQICATPEELSRRAAELFVDEAKRAVQAKGAFFVALSGGSTPKGFFSLLANDPDLRNAVPWAQTQFFWVDERAVPPNHPDSNYRLVLETLLSKVPAPMANIHRIRAQLPNARQAAEEYEYTLRFCFHLLPAEAPRFDLIYLGMGADGHTASLFPETEALAERERLVAANWVDRLNAWRITLTLPVLNQAARVCFLVSGAEKAEMLKKVLDEMEPARYPAQLVQPVNGEVKWLVDAAAAKDLGH